MGYDAGLTSQGPRRMGRRCHATPKGNNTDGPRRERRLPSENGVTTASDAEARGWPLGSPLSQRWVGGRDANSSRCREEGGRGFYNRDMRSLLAGGLLVIATASPSPAQTPLPFPRATAPAAEAPGRTPAPQTPAQPDRTVTGTQAAPAGGAQDGNGPAAATVGFAIVPGAQYLGSYDAGKGQRYYLYGTTRPYSEVVAYYRSELRDRGDEVFAEPPTHMFAQRFRGETMAFPPGVTVKDWTYGSRGYPNPRPGAVPERFPTVVMIVPAPPAAPASARP